MTKAFAATAHIAIFVLMIATLTHSSPAESKRGSRHDDEEHLLIMPAELPNAEQLVPAYEEQLLVFPQLEDEEGSPSTTPSPAAGVSIVDSIRTLHANGTSEYKLELSNGVTSYKKTYQKTVKGQLVTVQEGYDTVPMPGPYGAFLTQHYKADENGNKVYKVSYNSRRPPLVRS